jgi:hypothetical protein
MEGGLSTYLAVDEQSIEVIGLDGSPQNLLRIKQKVSTGAIPDNVWMLNEWANIGGVLRLWRNDPFEEYNYPVVKNPDFSVDILKPSPESTIELDDLDGYALHTGRTEDEFRGGHASCLTSDPHRMRADVDPGWSDNYWRDAYVGMTYKDTNGQDQLRWGLVAGNDRDSYGYMDTKWIPQGKSSPFFFIAT